MKKQSEVETIQEVVLVSIRTRLSWRFISADVVFHNANYAFLMQIILYLDDPRAGPSTGPTRRQPRAQPSGGAQYAFLGFHVPYVFV